MAKAKRNNRGPKKQTAESQGGTEQKLAQPRSRQGAKGSGQTEQAALSRRDQSMPAVLNTPFSFMRRFGEEMDRLVGEFGLGQGIIQQGLDQLAAWTPQVEMFERDGQLVVRADLPGVKTDDVEVELRDNSVVIKGERQEQHEEQREGYYRTERSYGSFYRQIPLPEGVNTENAKAGFRDGVLEITMPAPKGETRGRQLSIQDSGEQPQAKAKAAGASR